MHQYSNNNTFGAFIDVDEFFVLRKHASIKDFVKDLAPRGGSIVVNWSSMCSSKKTAYEPKPVLERFISTCPPNMPVNAHIKAVVYFAHALRPNIHSTVMKPGYPTVDTMCRPVDSTAHWVFGNNREVAYLNHYHTKSWEEYWKKKMRGNADNLVHPMAPHQNNISAITEEVSFLYEAHNVNCTGIDTFARDLYRKNLYVL